MERANLEEMPESTNRSLTSSEIQRMRGAFRTQSPTGTRNRAIFEVMYRAGLRSFEVVRLRPKDINLEKGTLRVVKGKRGKTRVVPMDPDLVHWARQWLGKRMPQAEWFFHTTKGGTKAPKGTQLSTRSVRSMFARAKDLAGLDDPDLSPHCLRHTFATELMNNPNFEWPEVAALTGHANLRSLQDYLDADNEVLRAKIQQRPAEQGSLDAAPSAEALVMAQAAEKAGITPDMFQRFVAAMVPADDFDELEASDG